jgi:hypothetical protein
MLTLEPGNTGTVEYIQIDSLPPARFIRVSRTSSSGQLRLRARSDALTARLTNGAEIKQITLSKDARATVSLGPSLSELRPRDSASTDADASYDRSSIVSLLERSFDLHVPKVPGPNHSLALLRVDIDSGDGARNFPQFDRECGVCHRTAQRFPANFLYGDVARVKHALASCAQRIFVRLSMWDVPVPDRVKTPMPPPFAITGMHGSATSRLNSETARGMRDTVADLMRKQDGTPGLAALLANGYENLRPCIDDQTRH